MAETTMDRERQREREQWPPQHTAADQRHFPLFDKSSCRTVSSTKENTGVLQYRKFIGFNVVSIVIKEGRGQKVDRYQTE